MGIPIVMYEYHIRSNDLVGIRRRVRHAAGPPNACTDKSPCTVTNLITVVSGFIQKSIVSLRACIMY